MTKPFACSKRQPGGDLQYPRVAAGDRIRPELAGDCDKPACRIDRATARSSVKIRDGIWQIHNVRDIRCLATDFKRDVTP